MTGLEGQETSRQQGAHEAGLRGEDYHGASPLGKMGSSAKSAPMV